MIDDMQVYIANLGKFQVRLRHHHLSLLHAPVEDRQGNGQADDFIVSEGGAAYQCGEAK